MSPLHTCVGLSTRRAVAAASVDALAVCLSALPARAAGEISVSTVEELEAEATDAANAGKTILLAPGPYVLRQRLILASGVSLVAERPGVVIVASALPSPGFAAPFTVGSVVALSITTSPFLRAWRGLLAGARAPGP